MNQFCCRLSAVLPFAWAEVKINNCRSENDADVKTQQAVDGLETKCKNKLTTIMLLLCVLTQSAAKTFIKPTNQ